MNNEHLSFSVCLSLSVSVSASLCLTVSVCLSLSLPVCLCLTLPASLFSLYSKSPAPIFRISALFWRCLLGLPPAYLRDLCYLTLGTRGCSSLRSMERGILFVPFAHTSTRQTRSFSVVCPFGMGFHWNCDCSPGFTLTNSTLALKLFILAEPESGALLNSNFEETLYK